MCQELGKKDILLLLLLIIIILIITITIIVILIITRMCRELRKKDILSEVLRLSHDRSLNKYADVDDEDDFQVFFIFILLSSKLSWQLHYQEVVEPPPIMPATTYQLTLAFPDFSQYKVIT